MCFFFVFPRKFTPRQGGQPGRLRGGRGPEVTARTGGAGWRGDAGWAGRAGSAGKDGARTAKGREEPAPASRGRGPAEGQGRRRRQGPGPLLRVTAKPAGDEEDDVHLLHG